MKKIIILLILVITTTDLFAQTQKNTLSDSSPKRQDNTAVYQLFPTQNMWTFIKLNTRNGQMWQVQFDVKGTNRFETKLNPFSLATNDEEVNNRFTLYPTQNIYNFMLLDQLDGRTWQVQWSMEPENRGIMLIK